MFNLKYILIISLISFTLQDSHCLVTSTECYDEEPTTNAGGIANCEEAEKGVCYECVYGYALSSNQKSCIAFENCYILAEGDKNCKECNYNFHPIQKVNVNKVYAKIMTKKVENVKVAILVIILKTKNAKKLLFLIVYMWMDQMKINVQHV